ncbi:MAG TPA: hypothetical protein VEU47_19315 [Candidatus Cybelea sp.]|nr:hypothetical protein [Candidatus Cybelea sp.]
MTQVLYDPHDGTVVDAETGRPVAGATLRIWTDAPSNVAPVTAESDGSGKFHLAKVEFAAWIPVLTYLGDVFVHPVYLDIRADRYEPAIFDYDYVKTGATLMMKPRH